MGLNSFMFTDFFFLFSILISIYNMKSTTSFGHSDSDSISVPYILIYASQNPYSEDTLLYYYIYVSNIALLKFLFCLPLKFARLADFFHSTQTNIKVGSRKSIRPKVGLLCDAKFLWGPSKNDVNNY